VTEAVGRMQRRRAEAVRAEEGVAVVRGAAGAVAAESVEGAGWARVAGWVAPRLEAVAERRG